MSGNWSRIIVHVDMDAFFASVEQILHPEWQGKPVIVGADPKKGKGRGVVSAASYEARKYGVRSALPISQAYKLCPHGIFTYPNGKAYKEYSNQVFEIFREFSPKIEPLSIDEAFLDMSGSIKIFGTVENLGRQIKTKIYEKTGLRASAGIAITKSVAKIASDFDKPDGLTIVSVDKTQEFLDQLSVTKLWGVGAKSYETLQKLGIHKVSQLRQYPLDVLEQKFGKMGVHIYNMARGIDPRDVHPLEDAKSVSNEITFSENQTDFEMVKNTVFALSEKVGGRMRKAGLHGKTLHLKIRFYDFKTYTRSHTLTHLTNLTEDIYENARHLLDEFNPLRSPVRLLGVGLSQLSNENSGQLSFWDIENKKKLQAEKVMDQIQERFGTHSILHAQTLMAKNKRFQKTQNK